MPTKISLGLKWTSPPIGLCALAVAVVSIIFYLPPTFAESAEPADTAKGKEIFIQKGCYVCHGYVGQGWAGGKRLAEPTLPLVAFTALTRKPNGSMPPFSSKVLTDNELKLIHRYLSSLESPNVEDIPLLKLQQE